VATVVCGDFEWDDAKAEANVKKHGVSFEEAATVFADPRAIFMDDGSGDGPIAIIGLSVNARTLYVVHVERGTRDRIVSARQATKSEETVYSEG
jgi:uncharacterized DUF497 family protein